ncbi:MAG: DNA mismatch repair protein MutS [Desulfobacterales bacterium]|nr:DNA mismatch repair protein MutS [Desulfobacterales bacterium]
MPQSEENRLPPRQEYQRRLKQRQSALSQTLKRDLLLSQLRGIVFFTGIVIAVMIFSFELFSVWWLSIPLLLFVTLVVVHENIRRLKEHTQQAVAHYKTALDRLEHNWHGKGIADTSYVEKDHPFAADLDLFGENSLFELLCTARTRSGEESLAHWLSERSSAQSIFRRQQGVEELRHSLDLREDMAILCGGVRAELRPDILTSWATAKSAFESRESMGLSVLAWFFACAAIGAGVAWKTTQMGPLPLIAVALAEWAVSSLLKKKLTVIVDTVDRASRELKVLVSLLKRLEMEQFHSEYLGQLQKRLQAGDRKASMAISELSRLVSWLEARLNQVFAPFAFLLMWSLHFSLAIERWRLRSGPHIPGWLQALGELEAMCALAGYAYEHPADPFPEIVEGETLFVAKDLGHPLLKEDVCVRNDVELGTARVWLVSGSNMSGKSTLLRTVGINVVLAMAGAPVRATSIKMSLMSIGATIRLQDSLLEGTSRFYAEIARLRQLWDLAEQSPPLLFLLDEILHGTNSHDRRVGAVALIREFINAGAIGLVTTHDLAISDATEDLGDQLRDVHFVDTLDDNKLVFDYKVRPGVVQKSNALEWMRAVGLKV